MKRSISLLLILLLITPAWAFAESAQDFGMGYIDFFSALSLTSEFSMDDLDLESMTCDPNDGYVCLTYNDYSFFLYVNTQTRNINKISLFFPQSKVSDKASDYGYMIGSMISVIIPSMETDTFQKIASDLGMLSDSVLLSTEPQRASVYDDDYAYSFYVVPSSDTFIFIVKCKSVPATEYEVLTDDAENCLQKMIASGGLDVGVYYAYDKQTDLNSCFGELSSYGSKINFSSKSINPNAVSTPSLSVDDGGSIEVFYNSSDLFNRVTTLYQIGYFESELGCRTIWNGKYLLRLSNSMSMDSVAKYTCAFYSVVE